MGFLLVLLIVGIARLLLLVPLCLLASVLRLRRSLLLRSRLCLTHALLLSGGLLRLSRILLFLLADGLDGRLQRGGRRRAVEHSELPEDDQQDGEQAAGENQADGE